MDLRHAHAHALARRAALAALVALAAAGAAAGAAGCDHHRQPGYDWRAPAPGMRCGSDADCGDWLCGFEPGATEGVCVPPGSVAAPGDDGGDAGPGEAPGPDVTPRPSDIKL